MNTQHHKQQIESAKLHESLGDLAPTGSLAKEWHYTQAINALPVPIPDEDFKRLCLKKQTAFYEAV